MLQDYVFDWYGIPGGESSLSVTSGTIILISLFRDVWETASQHLNAAECASLWRQTE